jgi:hypothetical protein
LCADKRQRRICSLGTDGRTRLAGVGEFSEDLPDRRELAGGIEQRTVEVPAVPALIARKPRLPLHEGQIIHHLRAGPRERRLLLGGEAARASQSASAHSVTQTGLPYCA